MSAECRRCGVFFAHTTMPRSSRDPDYCQWCLPDQSVIFVDFKKRKKVA